jgi:DNA invertase Pin-like site-specific DNA recombinase
MCEGAQAIGDEVTKCTRCGETGWVCDAHVSGARADNRRELAKALGALAPGGTLVVTRLDRLARSTRHLLNILHQLAEKGAKSNLRRADSCGRTCELSLR